MILTIFPIKEFPNHLKLTKQMSTAIRNIIIARRYFLLQAWPKPGIRKDNIAWIQAFKIFTPYFILYCYLLIVIYKSYGPNPAFDGFPLPYPKKIFEGVYASWGIRDIRFSNWHLKIDRRELYIFLFVKMSASIKILTVTCYYLT